MQARVLLLTLLITTPLTAQADDLVVLLQQRNCPDCRLADVDLAHADLRYADLQRAQLQGANLGQARLDGANFKGADLSFTSLRGASLREADFTGSRLYGTDLREADLREPSSTPKPLKRQAKNKFSSRTIAVKDQISDQLTNGFPLQRHTITAHAFGPTNNALLPTTPLFPTTHQARVVHQHQHRLEINQPPPSQTQCCELRQLTKSRQWHTTLPTAFMLSTMTGLNHSLSETFKDATSSS